MSRIVQWVKLHKLATFLLLTVAFLVIRDLRPAPFLPPMLTSQTLDVAGPTGLARGSLSAPSFMPSYGETAPAPQVKDRMVVSWSNLSLQVADVAQSLLNIKTYAGGLGGYMVDSSASNPLKVASGSITVRVPATKLDEALAHLRGLAVQVVSEQLTGTDVTDQFVDTQARLAILEKTKARFEDLATEAVTFSDIMQANQQILAVQDQIDALKGRQNFLTKTAEMAKVTVYLSTDEFALPYSPSEPWRPEIIFKEAVRSLVGHARDAGTAVIWLLVYGIVIVPTAVVAYVVYRVISKKKVL